MNAIRSGDETLPHFDGLERDLYWWIDFFNIALFKKEIVSPPLLTFQKSRVTTLAFHEIHCNGIPGMIRININRRYIDHPMYDILQILIHEMTHLWERQYISKRKRTKSWYHTKAFRNKMASFGIHSNTKGNHLAAEDPFVHYLRQHGVSFEFHIKPGKLISLPRKELHKGRSKLKKWTCGCQNIRVGSTRFFATCNRCGNKFKPVD